MEYLVACRITSGPAGWSQRYPLRRKRLKPFLYLYFVFCICIMYLHLRLHFYFFDPNVSLHSIGRPVKASQFFSSEFWSQNSPLFLFVLQSKFPCFGVKFPFFVCFCLFIFTHHLCWLNSLHPPCINVTNIVFLRIFFQLCWNDSGPVLKIFCIFNLHICLLLH